MKTLFQTFLCASLLFSFSTQSIIAQGIIVNEGGNGASGNQDFFELLVVGSAAQPTGTVDLSGWVVDDNNGEFGGGGSGKGIAQGHIRFKASCFSAIPIGAIIIIYNAEEKEVSIPADDPTDANGDLVYIFPNTSTCFERCTAAPTSTNTSYNTGSCSYTNTFTATQWSSTLGLSGSKDAFQTRKPDGSFFHGFGYGYSGASANIVPTFPSEMGGGNGFNMTGAASGTSINFYCGAPNDPNNYAKEDATTLGTPGAANNAANAIMIANMRAGTFDYTDWANPANCEMPLLPLELLSFEAKANSFLENLLNWQLEKVEPNTKVYIERSEDGFNFETINILFLEGDMALQSFSFLDNTPYYTTYYRLRFEEPMAVDFYSAIRVVTHNKVGEQTIALYPNPTYNVLNISFSEAISNTMQYDIIDALGRVVAQGILTAGQNNTQISTDFLSSGTYSLRLNNTQDLYIIKKFIKL